MMQGAGRTDSSPSSITYQTYFLRQGESQPSGGSTHTSNIPTATHKTVANVSTGPQVIDKRRENSNRGQHSSSSTSVRRTSNLKEDLVSLFNSRGGASPSQLLASGGTPASTDSAQVSDDAETDGGVVVANHDKTPAANTGPQPPQFINRSGVVLPQGAEFFACLHQELEHQHTTPAADYQPLARGVDSHATFGESREASPVQKNRRSQRVKTSTGSDEHLSKPILSSTATDPSANPTSTDRCTNESPENVVHSRGPQPRGPSPASSQTSSSNSHKSSSSRTIRGHTTNVLPSKKDTSLFRALRTPSTDSLAATGDEISSASSIRSPKDDSPQSSVHLSPGSGVTDAAYQRTPRPPHPLQKLRKNSNTGGSNASLVEPPSAAEDNDTDENTLVDMDDVTPPVASEKLPADHAALPPKKVSQVHHGKSSSKPAVRTNSTVNTRSRPVPSRHLIMTIQDGNHHGSSRLEDGPSDDGGESNIDEEHTSQSSSSPLRRYSSLRSMPSNEILDITGGVPKQSILTLGVENGSAQNRTMIPIPGYSSGITAPKIHSSRPTELPKGSPPKVTFNVPESANEGERRRPNSFRLNRKKATRPTEEFGVGNGFHEERLQGTTSSNGPYYLSENGTSTVDPSTSRHGHHHRSHHPPSHEGQPSMPFAAVHPGTGMGLVKHLRTEVPTGHQSQPLHSSRTLCSPQGCVKVQEHFLDQTAYYMKTQLEDLRQFQEGRLTWEIYRQTTLQALRVQQHSLEYLIQEFEKTSASSTSGNSSSAGGSEVLTSPLHHIVAPGATGCLPFS